MYIAWNEPGGNPGSILGHLGMPPGGGDGTGLLHLRAGISKAIDAVTQAESKVTGKRVGVNRVVRRWASYLGMVMMRNMLPEAENEASRLLAAHHNGMAELVEVMAAEEYVIYLREMYLNFKRRNDALRKGSLYLKLMGVLRERLLAEGIKV